MVKTGNEREHAQSTGYTSGAVGEGLGDALGRPAQPLSAVVIADPHQQRAHRQLHGVPRRLPAAELHQKILLLVVIAHARGDSGEVGLLERSHGGKRCPPRAPT